MSRFKSRSEQKSFIDDSNGIFNELLSKIPVQDRPHSTSIVDQYYAKWNKVFKLEPEKNPMDTIDKDTDKIQKLYDELKASVVLPDNNPAGERLVFNTIDECVERLRSLKRNEMQRGSSVRFLQYQTGKVMFKLKSLCNTRSTSKQKLKKAMAVTLHMHTF